MAPIEIHTNVTMITGGGLGSSLKTAWIPTTKEVQGRTFFVCDRIDPKMAKLVRNDFTMHDHLVQLRNQAVERAMKETCGLEDDPMVEEDGSGKCPRGRGRK